MNDSNVGYKKTCERVEKLFCLQQKWVKEQEETTETEKLVPEYVQWKYCNPKKGCH